MYEVPVVDDFVLEIPAEIDAETISPAEILPETLLLTVDVYAIC